MHLWLFWYLPGVSYWSVHECKIACIKESWAMIKLPSSKRRLSQDWQHQRHFIFSPPEKNSWILEQSSIARFVQYTLLKHVPCQQFKQVLLADQISSRYYCRTRCNSNLWDFSKMSSSSCCILWAIILVAVQAPPRDIWVLLTREVFLGRCKPGWLSTVVVVSAVVMVTDDKKGETSLPLKQFQQ